MGKKPIFNDPIGHGAMAANAQIIGAAGNHGGAKGHPHPGAQGHGHQADKVEQHRKLFVGPLGAVERLHGHQPTELALGRTDAGQKVGSRLGIGIKKHQQFARAGLAGLVQGPVLAGPTGGQGGAGQERGASGLGDRGGVITGMVIDHEHLQGLEGLPLQGSQETGQGAGLIAGRDQHRQLQLWGQIRRQGNLGQPGQPQTEKPADQPAHQQGDGQQVHGQGMVIRLARG